MPEGAAGWAGYVIAALTILATWLQSKRKSDVDESALVLGKWKELVEQHQADIKTIRDEFAAYKKAAIEEFATYKRTAEAEIDSLRSRLAAAEKRIAEQDTVIGGLKEENAGLKRAVAQNSQSAAVIFGRSPLNPDPASNELVEKLDRAGDNSMKGSST